MEKKIDLPGYSRVSKLISTARKELKQMTGVGDILFLHSGDFLFPSFLSNYFKGKQIVEMLNYCNLDCCTLGNHDFDGGKKVLRQRIKESKFKYVVTNLLPPRELSGIIDRFSVWPTKRPVIAILGIVGETTASKAKKNGFREVATQKALKQYASIITKQYPHVRCLVLLSHMSDEEDFELKSLVSKFWRGNSIILGGHDHNDIISYDSKNKEKCILLKGQSNARTIRMIILTENILREDSDVDFSKNILIYDSNIYDKIAPERKIQKKIEKWFALLEKKEDLRKDNIIKIFPRGTILNATEHDLRRGTTNFGNFVADCVKEFTGADISFVNSGHFRGDRKVGRELTEFHLKNIFVLDQKGSIVMPELTKKECMLLLKHSYNQIGKGKILQISKDALKILKKKSNEKVKVAIISDMIYVDDDNFGKILADSRNITTNALRKEFKKYIIKNFSLIDIIKSVAAEVKYDPTVRLTVDNLNKPRLFYCP